jgi:hypothetical protein
MTFVPIEKCKTLNDPGVEAAADMPGDFLDNVTAISEPGKLRPGRYRKHGFFTFFAMISELHRRSIPVPAAKASVSFRSARLLGACRRICPPPARSRLLRRILRCSPVTTLRRCSLIAPRFDETFRLRIGRRADSDRLLEAKTTSLKGPAGLVMPTPVGPGRNASSISIERCKNPDDDGPRV